MKTFACIAEKFPHLTVEESFSFSRHTSIGCGGVAALAAFPSCMEEAAELLCFLERENIPHCFLGSGANVLPADGYFEGVIVQFSKLKSLFSDGDSIFAAAGVTGGSLCRFAREKGLSGFEPFTGIPMTVGGGVTMNAGVQGGHFSDVLERVVGIEKGKIRTFAPSDCAFSEKKSIFQSGIAVVGAYLRGKSCSQAEINARTEYYRNRRAHLPKGRSMGCTFVNPEGESAGRLIENCGLKGRRIGGAKVSEIHANFILNEDGTASDVQRLIEAIKEEVHHRTGILLREEIRRIP